MLSPAQQAYAKAKALYETLEAKATAEIQASGCHSHIMAAIKADNRDEALRLTVQEEAIREKLRVYQARNAMLEAENLLIEWVQQKLRSDPKVASRMGEVAQLFANYQRHPAIREKMIDLAMRLAAGE